MVSLTKKPVAKIKAIIYTGDGTTDRVVSLGWRPDIFWIFPRLHGEDYVRGADVESLTPERSDPIIMDTKDHITSAGVNVGYVHGFTGEGNVNGVKYVLIGVSQ